MRGTLKQPQLLSEAFALERKISPVGIQDFLPSIFGNLLEARHTLVRAAMHEYHKPLPPCTLSIVSDVPKGTGLGSSSALTTALVQLMRGTLKQPQLLSEAFALERKVSPVGIQDFLPSIFGNFNIYRIDTGGNVEVTAVPMHLCRLIQQYGLLLYTGIDRHPETSQKK
jgi:galactokinase/mevalonate kinase-like predicted kinase